ncbi:MAG: PLDc N-terminal domain-containing protein [Deltaproteobacteria bacterium]|jgi:hypothetical protein|nr:PLDc N-terminal domain-containing protein [Deltaproteobacteria bacterium]
MTFAMLDLTPAQLALCFAPALINLWAIWHAATRKFPSPIEQAVWIAAGMLVPVLGGLAYLCFGLRRSNKV